MAAILDSILVLELDVITLLEITGDENNIFK